MNLNKTMRLDITNKIIRKAFHEQEKKADDERRALGKQLLDAALGEEVVKLMEKMPEGLFTVTRDYFSYRPSTAMRGRHHYCTAGVRVYLPRDTQVPAATIYGTPIAGTRESDKSYPAYAKAEDKHGEIIKKTQELRDRTMAQLGSFRTLKALRAAWPEIAEFTKEYGDGSTSKAVAEPISQLNIDLGLVAKE